MAKVSVIIPVYNVEKYLGECLDSVINQTLKDIEIICIDDGSDDSSLEILEEYASSDDRIQVFSQEHQGLSAARNKGLEYSAGDYVYFIDSDDILELSALEELLKITQDKDLDMVMFKLMKFDDDTKKKYTSPYYEMDNLAKLVKDNVFNYQGIGEEVFQLNVTSPSKFFKKSLIEDLRFPEGVIFEDNLFFTEAIFKAERVYFYKKHLYNRRIRKNSITTTNNEDFMDCIIVFNMVNEHMKEINLFDDYKRPLYNRKINSTYYRFTLIDDDLKEEFFKRIKEDFLLHKDEFEADEDFLKVLTPKSKCIFYSAISSQTHKEFEYEVELFKSKMQIKKLKKSNKDLKKQISDLKSTKAYRFWEFYHKLK